MPRHLQFTRVLVYDVLMKIQDIPYNNIDWKNIQRTEHKGETGTSYWQTFQQGNLRIRMVEKTPGFLADHWCSRGHVILVLEGEMIFELKDGTRHRLSAGMSCVMQDDEDNPHRTSSENGVKTFIID